MTSIPVSAREFERWMAESREAWPADLVAAGARALLAMKSLDQPRIETMHVLIDEAKKDLMAFAEAYGSWKSDQKNHHQEASP